MSSQVEMRVAAVAQYGEDYVVGVDLAKAILVAAGRGEWTKVASLDQDLDPNNDRMMDGYNDAFSALMDSDPNTVEAVLAYMAEHEKKCLN